MWDLGGLHFTGIILRNNGKHQLTHSNDSHEGLSTGKKQGI